MFGKTYLIQTLNTLRCRNTGYKSTLKRADLKRGLHCGGNWTYPDPTAAAHWQTPWAVPIRGNSTIVNPHNNHADRDFHVLLHWTNAHPVVLSIIWYAAHLVEFVRCPHHRCVCGHLSSVARQTRRGPARTYRCPCDRRCQSAKYWKEREREKEWVRG